MRLRPASLAWLSTLAVSLAGTTVWSAPPRGKAPTVQDALKLAPVQREIDFDKPADDEAARCTMKPEKLGGKTGWVVRDSAGQVLRHFIDGNADGYVDQWCYFKDGIEVYRDIDSNANEKADQYRWLGTAGTRWGVDQNEDGRIDAWRAISAEEVTAEVVAALKERDSARFTRLLLAPRELQGLGLGTEATADLTKRIEAAPAAFKQLAASQNVLGADARWVYFGGSRPGIVPAGTNGSTEDLTVYENVAAMIESAGKHGQLPIGTLVKAGEAWRLIDVPQLGENVAETEPNGYFFRAPQRREVAQNNVGRPNEETQKLMAELEDIDKQIAAGSGGDDLARKNDRRVQILVTLANKSERPQDRTQWLRQLIDTVSASAQMGTFPNGQEVLKALRKQLKGKDDAELISHLDYSLITIDYFQQLQPAGADYPKIQAAWLETLEKFIADHPGAPEAADAKLQLAVAADLAGNEADALKHYNSILSTGEGTPAYRKAQGAKTRLESVGQPIALAGKTIDGKTFNLAQLKGNVVLIHYWSSTAEPSTANLPILKDLLARFGKKDFKIVGVNLDARAEDLQAYLAGNPLNWPQLFEVGGLDSRLANEMGIHTLPTMLLVDRQGRVANRGIHAEELEKELKPLLK